MFDHWYQPYEVFVGFFALVLIKTESNLRKEKWWGSIMHPRCTK